MKIDNVSLFGASVKPIGLACDHAGIIAKNFIISKLEEKAIPYIDFGTYSAESTDYPDYAHQVARLLKQANVILALLYVVRVMASI